MLTVTSVETVAAHPRLREHGGALDGAARACEAVARIFDDGDPHTGVYHLLANELALLDRDPARAGRANSLAFRLKLLLAAGFAPHLAGCASCGEREHLVGFSGAAGGVVCGACEANAFPLDEEAHAFMVAALGRPLADAPDASPRALAQAERAITTRSSTTPTCACAPSARADGLRADRAAPERFAAHLRAAPIRGMCERARVVRTWHIGSATMSRFSVALIAAAVLAALPASASGAIRSFRSPTGKLGCMFYSDAETPRQVRCEWKGGQRPRPRPRRDRQGQADQDHRHGASTRTPSRSPTARARRSGS